MFVCICRAVTVADLRRLGRLGISSPDDLVEVLRLDASDCCGACARNINSLAAIARSGAAEKRAVRGLRAPYLAEQMS